ncbi:motility associated factor glycosyltransferase family protein [Lysinibacillus sphaericus]|uniref:6-hydroxymethylpterin diphosphokinase MptE-like domain-containing protein n=1 Tax=Lysinibacillus sphaericus OT4b.31 TaxID=1285586 RepID=R7Z8Z1_LYSSH|nr:6-hydroxymethylpterin diphosphokinase MptE-like protein [Lysinibacillus sphaericus]EON70436.1 hypothetical protein H131_21507 [Lysinibacillus sphaericus OT4b.31]
MNFEKLKAKNGEDTLKVNGLLLYSKYQPIIETDKFIRKEVKLDADGYLLVGLGLGYHLSALVKLIDKRKRITVLCLDKKEIDLYKKSIVFDSLENADNIKIVTEIANLELTIKDQVIIPHVCLQLMNKNHPLFNYLTDIKIKQMSFKRFRNLMEYNFGNNCKLNDFRLCEYQSKLNMCEKQLACIVASGPSLEETKKWLHRVKEEVYILCVGSALKVLLNEGIKPDAVIITDSQKEISIQLQDVAFEGQLFYLSTADYDTIKAYPYARIMLLQNGYEAAELLAPKVNYPLLETGGSVATTAFSLLKYLGFDKLVLFGQDLGFSTERTHASGSTSGRKVNHLEDTIEVISNEGKKIRTLPNLYSYLKWFEMKIKVSNIHVYNTAAKGAKVNGATVVNEVEFLSLINNSDSRLGY